MSRRAFVGWFVGLLALALMGRVGFLDAGRLADAGGRLAEFSRDLFPPDLQAAGLLSRAMLETIEIAFLGTLLGFVFSLPLAFWADRALFGPAVSGASRAFFGAVRTVPSILFGVVFVVAFGLGPAAGTAAVALYTVGYLAKLFSEAFEDVDEEVIQAVKSTGAGRLQVFWFAVLPESANAILSQLLFMFEYNIRASTILGFVGAGGIGYYMLGYVQMLQYPKLMTAVLMTFAVVMALDFLSSRLRSKLGRSVPSKSVFEVSA